MPLWSFNGAQGYSIIMFWSGRSILYLVGKVIFANLFVFAGVSHFVSPAPFLKIMPPYIPWHYAMVLISGVFEVALGVGLLVPRTSRIAAWGLIALLITVFPANIYLYQHQNILPAPPLIHLLRLPLQGVAILWAYVYTKSSSAKPKTLHTDDLI